MGWQIASDLTSAEVQAFQDQDSALGLKGESINDSKTNFTQRVEVGGKFYYVKRYLQPGKNLRRFIGQTRVNREWINLTHLEKIGVPSPRRIAVGQGNRWFGEYWGVIVSEEAADTIDLRKVHQQFPELLQSRHWRVRVMSTLAKVIADMHDNGFIHNDLNWRNVLVNKSGDEVYLIDCPAGRPIYLVGNRRGMVRDLAFLDKLAKDAISKTDRLRFYMMYRGIDHLRTTDKIEIRRILQFLSEQSSLKR